jgi:diguanylate cyclase (GGDEF)-like protein
VQHQGQGAEDDGTEPAGRAAPVTADGSASPQLLGIDHVQLAMPSGPEAELEAERFYGGLLGFERVAKPPDLAVRGGCWFHSAAVDLHLGVEEPFRPARKAHPALMVDELAPLEARLRDAGVDVVPADPVDDRRRVHVSDPFGNRIEVVETREPSVEVFRAMADTAVNPFCLVGNDGVVHWVGESVQELLGWPPHAMVGRRLDEIITPGTLPQVIEALAMLDDVPTDYPRAGVGVPADLVRSDGTSTPVDLIGAPSSHTGLPWHIVFAQRTGYQRALDRALEAMAENAQLSDVLAHLAAAIEQAIPSSSVAVCDRWQQPHFDVVSGSAADLLVAEADSPWARALATGEDVLVASLDDLPDPLAALARARGLSSCWVHPVTVTGDEAPVAAFVIWRPLDGLPTNFTWRAVERTGKLLRLTLQWDRSHRALEYAATHDTLTGVANRQVFVDRLQELATAGAGASAVLFIDLDHFKPVNDDLGHPAGDRVLVKIADRLLSALRPGDLVARVGGDEFAVLCERLAGPDDAEAVAARLLDLIAEPVLACADSGNQVSVGGSIGLTDVGPGDGADTVLARADLAMREAKSQGRGRWVRHPAPARGPG